MAQGGSPRSDDAFPKTVAEILRRRGRWHVPARIDSPLLPRSTREFFHVDGAYFWQRVSTDELMGAEADGVSGGQVPRHQAYRQPERRGYRGFSAT